jgi:MFS family permease
MKPPLVTGLLLAAVGFVLFSLAPIGGSFAVNVLPGTLMVGIGIGMASTPLLLATMSDVAPCESGLASGVVSTASMMAGTLGLAALVSVADSRTKELMASGANMSVALNQGYHVAFFSGALLAVAAASIGAAFLCVGRYESVGDSERRGSVAAANVSDE